MNLCSNAYTVKVNYINDDVHNGPMSYFTYSIHDLNGNRIYYDTMLYSLVDECNIEPQTPNKMNYYISILYSLIECVKYEIKNVILQVNHTEKLLDEEIGALSIRKPLICFQGKLCNNIEVVEKKLTSLMKHFETVTIYHNNLEDNISLEK